MEHELMIACYRSNVAKVYQLVKKGVNINIFNDDGYTPLIVATMYHNKHICKILIDNGANLNIVSVYSRQSAIFFALSYKYRVILEYLISRDANINLRDRWGNTALTVVLRRYEKSYYEKKTCELLIDKGAEVSDEDLELIVNKGWKDLCLKVIRNRTWERRKHLLACFKHVRKI